MNPEPESQELIAISNAQFVEQLNQALGEENRGKGLVFFASPNHLHPGHVDWVRGKDVDAIYIAALGKVEAKYRIIPEDIVPDNVGRAY